MVFVLLRECLPGLCPSLGLPKLCTEVAASSARSNRGTLSRVVVKAEAVEAGAEVAAVASTDDNAENTNNSDDDSEEDNCCWNTAIQTRTFPAVEVFLTEPTLCCPAPVSNSPLPGASPKARGQQQEGSNTTATSSKRKRGSEGSGKSSKATTDKKPVSKGYGLRVAEAVQRGTILVEYLGEVITSEECLRRMQAYSLEDAFYFAGLDNGLMLDAKVMGSVARFANHSCDPSCTLQKWTVQGECRLVLVAMRDLLPGDEVQYVLCCFICVCTVLCINDAHVVAMFKAH